MKRTTLDIRAGRLFPFHFLAVGGVFLVTGIAVAASHPMVAVALIPLSILVFTAHEGTDINAEAGTLREYYSFFFLKTGKFRRHGGLDSIAIHRAKVSRRMFSPRTTQSSTFTHVEYNAYLKLAGGEKIFLFGGRNKLKVLDRSQQVAKTLRITVRDHALPA